MSEDILTRPPPTADERLWYGSHSLHFGDLRLPTGDGPHAVVVYIHGGFWRERYDLEHAGHPCAAITAAGIATWNIEYRRIGNGGGWPATFEDVAAAADHVRTLAPIYNLDLDRVAVAGHSAGGHLALWLAARHRIPEGIPLFSPTPLRLCGAISLAGVNDLRLAWEWRLGSGIVRDLMGGTPEKVPERYAVASPPDLFPLGTPQTLVHGTEDRSVPYEISVRYRTIAAAVGDAVELIPLEGTGHFEPVDPRSVEWPVVLRAIQDTVSERENAG